MTIPEHTICRACGSKNLFNVADFGKQVPANSFRDSFNRDPEERFPLALRVCSECWLGQLSHVVPKEVLYSYYPYVTSTSKTMAAHLLNLCQNILSRTNLLPRVIEIGSNTGLLLKEFQARHSKVTGFEPAKNIAELANLDGVPTRPEFFNQASATTYVAENAKADVIIGRHVLAHIDSWRGLISALDAVCSKTGLIVFEVPYLVEILDGFQFDTVYHEHLSYVSLKAIETLLEDSPFFVQDIERNAIHGGSIVFYIRRRSETRRRATEVLDHIRILEESSKIGEPEIWAAWAAGVEELRDDIVETVKQVADAGVVGYGASAKGSMLLQYCDFKPTDVEFVADNTPFKQNKRMPGTGIPVLSPADFLSFNKSGAIRYGLILAWNFAREIKDNNTAFTGKWITPIPQVRID